MATQSARHDLFQSAGSPWWDAVRIYNCLWEVQLDGTNKKARHIVEKIENKLRKLDFLPIAVSRLKKLTKRTTIKNGHEVGSIPWLMYLTLDGPCLSWSSRKKRYK